MLTVTVYNLKRMKPLRCIAYCNMNVNTAAFLVWKVYHILQLSTNNEEPKNLQILF